MPLAQQQLTEIVKVLAVPEVRSVMENQGLSVIAGTPAEFTETMKTEIPYWGKIIKDAGIKAE